LALALERSGQKAANGYEYGYCRQLKSTGIRYFSPDNLPLILNDVGHDDLPRMAHERLWGELVKASALPVDVLAEIFPDEAAAASAAQATRQQQRVDEDDRREFFDRIWTKLGIYCFEQKAAAGFSGVNRNVVAQPHPIDIHRVLDPVIDAEGVWPGEPYPYLGAAKNKQDDQLVVRLYGLLGYADRIKAAQAEAAAAVERVTAKAGQILTGDQKTDQKVAARLASIGQPRQPKTAEEQAVDRRQRQSLSGRDAAEQHAEEQAEAAKHGGRIEPTTVRMAESTVNV
jgi:hypothetical protein